jgi:hypothetical protein
VLKETERALLTRAWRVSHVKFLAAIAAAAVPFTAFAQAPPPPPTVSLEAAPAPTPPVPAPLPELTTALSPEDGPLDLSRYPAKQRDAIWDRYASKTHVSVNLLNPVGGVIYTAVFSSFTQAVSGQNRGSISLPIELERCLNRSTSVFGVAEPGWWTNSGESNVAFTLGAGARMYFGGNAPQGFWMGLHAAGEVTKLREISTTIEAGGTWLFENHLTLSFGAGAGLSYASDVLLPFSNEHLYFFPTASIKFSVGYAI